MSETIINRENWTRAGQFDLFRTYDRPHFAVTHRLSVHNLLSTQKPKGVSPYRACLFAIGAGIHGVEELKTRFRDDVVVRHDAIELSMTVPKTGGGFSYAYVPFHADFATFDRTAQHLIEEAANSPLSPNTGQRDDLAYLSCMPWLDYSSINNAMPHARDCIPRVSWGKFVLDPDQVWRMSMTLEVHHAIVDGEHVAAYFDLVQQTLDQISA